MAFDFSGLTAYVDQFQFDLAAKTITEAKTAKLVGFQPGIKHKSTLNFIDVDIVMQAGGNCNHTPSGSTRITQKEIMVDPVAINMDLCLEDMDTFYTNQMMNPGSYPTDIPFHELYAQVMVKKLALENEKCFWVGNKLPGSPAPSNTNLLRTNGFLTHLNTDGGYVNGNPTSISTGTSVTSSNVRGIIDGVCNLIPSGSAYSDDLTLFVDIADYRTYTTALRNANLFNNAGENGEMEGFVQGTNIKMVAVPGLSGTHSMVLSRRSNLVIGTDSTSDMDSFVMQWFPYDKTFKARIDFKIGTQIRENDQVVYFKLV